MSVAIGTDTGFVDFFERPIHIGDVVSYTRGVNGCGLNVSVIRRITKCYIVGTSSSDFTRFRHRTNSLQGYDMASLIDELIKRTATHKGDELISPYNCIIVKKYNGQF